MQVRALGISLALALVSCAPQRQAPPALERGEAPGAIERVTDAAAEAALNELLGRLHGESQRAKVGEVTVDLRDLEFMNSSCFKSFITWIVAVRRLPEAQHYRIRFVSNAALHWQKRSLHAISYFGGELVSIPILFGQTQFGSFANIFYRILLSAGVNF